MIMLLRIDSSLFFSVEAALIRASTQILTCASGLPIYPIVPAMTSLTFVFSSFSNYWQSAFTIS